MGPCQLIVERRRGVKTDGATGVQTVGYVRRAETGQGAGGYTPTATTLQAAPFHRQRQERCSLIYLLYYQRRRAPAAPRGFDAEFRASVLAGHGTLAGRAASPSLPSQKY